MKNNKKLHMIEVVAGCAW